jgi:hypothetical protein
MAGLNADGKKYVKMAVFVSPEAFISIYNIST